eukprot:TRINITY_DN29809_c0_g1_i1.p1 TRINITY_DN29809_c0_g1~~TRINITY_DN29809_c0_g1_i1.p1  ORF type:complete len:420 (+),score=108.92 TRINITY_DN29809_c0_g1_i1:90-1349(+)
MPLFCRQLARYAAKQCGQDVSEEVVDELTPVLELRLLEQVRLASRLATRGRRTRLLRCDVDVGQAAAAQDAPEGSLEVQWLALDGKPVPFYAGPAQQPQEPQQREQASHAAAAADDEARDISSLARSLPEQSLLIARRLATILEDEGSSDAQRSKAVSLCRRPDMMSLRPLFLLLVCRQIARHAGDWRSRDLHFLLAVLEAVVLAHADMNIDLPRSLSAALTLCLTARSSATTGQEDVQEDCGFNSEGGVDASIGLRKRAAAFLGAAVRRCQDALPELRQELGETLTAVFEEEPPLEVSIGATYAVAALGAESVSEVLLPALRSGLLTLPPCCDRSEPAAVQPPPDKKRRLSDDKEGSSQLFAAMVAAWNSLRSGHLSTPRLREATLLSLHMRALFGVDPTPFYVAEPPCVRDKLQLKI